MIYPALGGRTDFSLGESTIAVKNLVKIAEDLQTDVVGICDTMSVSSLIDASKAFAKAGKKVVVGARIRVVDAAEKEATLSFIKLWPIDLVGLQSIYRLISRGFEADRFYYNARVTWDDIRELVATEHVVLTTGDLESAVQRQDSARHLMQLNETARFAAVFYELVPSATPYFSRQNHRARTIGQAMGAEPITIQPMFWEGDNALVYSINASIAENRPYFDYLRPATDFVPLAVEPLVKAAKSAADALTVRYNTAGAQGAQASLDAFVTGIKNTARLVDLCQYSWAKQDPCLPVIATDPDAALLEACKTGIRERFTAPVFGHQPTPQEIADTYVPRLKFELDTLMRLGFSQYFLLVADLVRWSKAQGILVGPGRGSVGGSLVAYLMGITDVDPIRFDLLFERFINPDRLDLPDADLDFMSTRREEVIRYLSDKYGEARVAGIVNYNTMGARDALRSVLRIHDRLDLAPITKFIGDTHGISATLEEAKQTVGEVEMFAEEHPLVWSQAVALEGKMRAFGQHAAGVVVAGEDIVNRAVIERRSDGRVINWDKRVSEDQGLVKLDVLGLATLDVFDYALKLIFQRHSKKIDLNSLDLFDADTLAVFSKAKTAGVFQFEGASVRRLLKQMAKSDTLTFEDLVALNALNRPGPLDAGLCEAYIERRAGIAPVTYDNPILEPVLRATYGVICYQEQVMQTARALCGFTPGEADVLRKAMGKKDPVMMAQQRDKFVQGAQAVSNMQPNAAIALFDSIEKFAGYAFNRSHAVEYTLIAYQAAWLKSHYLIEFYAAALSVSHPDKLPSIIKQANEDGITIIPPNINVSTAMFEPINDVIIAAPLSAVMHVSSKCAEAIVEARTSPEPVITEKSNGLRGKAREMIQTQWGPGRFVSIDDVRARLPGRVLTSRGIENLDKVGAFSLIEPGQLSATDARRKRDQIELMPGVMDQAVVAERVIAVDGPTGDAMANVAGDMFAALGNAAVPCHPGDDPRFMVILDAPLNDYDPLPKAYSFVEFIRPALTDAGLQVDHACWTWCARRPKRKGEREVPASEMATALPFLKREIDILKPPVILTLGPQSTRMFFPDLKGGQAEHVGKVAFSADLDATVIIGFNPSQIYHDEGKRETLAGLFNQVKRLIDGGCAP
jgi:DNA polymerase-3 subunit alpha